ncbi:MAG TPA: hypothetical protein VMU84_13925 [Thermoanaerobaculia bacterium]|nr:hypothetical protein [Thermoanaerobaculia bacterium]
MSDTDFTEAHFREVVRLAKRNYRFISFEEVATDERSILWRHDIDLSPHRALALARIEAEEGVTATYFVLLHSEYYNALEHEVAEKIVAIAQLGHNIGLHFDPAFYEAMGHTDIEGAVLREKELIEATFGVTLRAISWHNPSALERIDDRETVGGLINAYSASIREKFSYLSDSHGFWRFRRLHDVISAAEEPFLHILTHAEWWQREAMTPIERIARAIERRAVKQRQRYDEYRAKPLK